ncbi:putative transcription factor [Pseudocercospora fuligena]|uniref:Putative transcription factor n=1 Tax=Pseudocercospora fuligena TaxID=685502 RepID=A0A8H6RGH6_9PEZI|nr:putative transcription factor [Pseudocercospora fuligena]
MPRPPDNYTHAQFEPVESEHQGETVQCIHCRNWTGSIKTLNRKKTHLMNCPQYAQWRASGNGQDLAPPNKYQKRDSTTLSAWNVDADNPYMGNGSPYGYQTTPTMARGKNLDLNKYFDEFWDDSTAQKCMRVRCLSCGFVRAKNTTRQVEHLATCQDFLTSTEGQQAVQNGELEMTPAGPPPAYNNQMRGDIWRGGAPNPMLQVGNTPVNRPSMGGGGNRMQPPPRPQPSLASHLLNKWPDKLAKATQQQFLSHAGCGTLSATALAHWLGQNSHISRAMIAFIGKLIGKVSLPETSNSKTNTHYRALDLLVSTVSNIRKELDFIEATKRKHSIQSDGEPPSPMTKAYVDLLASAADTRSTLLEGMVALWATEHCYYASWQYASNFASNMPTSTYSVPSYLTQTNGNPYGDPGSVRPANGLSDQHLAALQEALIPNWTSREFSKFVEACRAIVDELANAETTGSGRDQLLRCEQQYQQVIYLWERVWPEVDGMGQENDLDDADVPQESTNLSQTLGRSQNHGNVAGPSRSNGTERKQEPIEIQDDDDNGQELSMDSPYGGTGLGAVAAANQAP